MGLQRMHYPPTNETGRTRHEHANATQRWKEFISHARQDTRWCNSGESHLAVVQRV
jgi:hypothetical protein